MRPIYCSSKSQCVFFCYRKLIKCPNLQLLFANLQCCRQLTAFKKLMPTCLVYMHHSSFFHSSSRCQVASSSLLLQSMGWTYQQWLHPSKTPSKLTCENLVQQQTTVTRTIRIETWPSSTTEDLLKNWARCKYYAVLSLCFYSSNQWLYVTEWATRFSNFKQI